MGSSTDIDIPTSQFEKLTEIEIWAEASNSFGDKIRDKLYITKEPYDVTIECVKPLDCVNYDTDT